MEKQTSRRWLWPLLIGLTLCFIWGNSLLPASVSGAISEWVRQVVNRLLWFLEGGSAVSGDGVLRKIAHASEFALLGAELFCWRGRKPSELPRALLGGILAALTDETIQLFVAGRSGEVRDVWIDTLGVVIGCALVLLIGCLRARRKRT